MFNSALLFEFAVLLCMRTYSDGVPRNCLNIAKHTDYLCLSNICSVQDKEIPAYVFTA
jgi:hypothetical protein